MANETFKPLTPAVGTILKIGVTAEIGNSLHLADVDFTCTVTNSVKRKGVTFTKGEMIREDDDNYFAVVDTSALGAGKYYVRLSVDVPDNDVEEGIRTEVVNIPKYIEVER